jgi:hypothetical protein
MSTRPAVRRLRALEREERGPPPRVLTMGVSFMVDTDDGGEVYRHDSAVEGAALSMPVLLEHGV